MANDFSLLFAQDPATTSNGGSTTPTAPAPGKKGKKSRGKDAGDSGNGDAGTVENNEPAPTAQVVQCHSCDLFETAILLFRSSCTKFSSL